MDGDGGDGGGNGGGDGASRQTGPNGRQQAILSGLFPSPPSASSILPGQHSQMHQRLGAEETYLSNRILANKVRWSTKSLGFLSPSATAIFTRNRYASLKAKTVSANEQGATVAVLGDQCGQRREQGGVDTERWWRNYVVSENGQGRRPAMPLASRPLRGKKRSCCIGRDVASSIKLQRRCCSYEIEKCCIVW